MKRKLLSILCLVLAFVLLFAQLPEFSVSAKAFGSYGADLESAGYVTDENPFWSYGYYGECTWYCFGRAYEKGTRLYWGNGINLGDAANWYQYASEAGYRCDNIPSANSILVSGGGAYGHVMFIERYENGYAYTSEANVVGATPISYGGYSGTYYEDVILFSPESMTGTRNAGNGNTFSYTGFIHLDDNTNPQFAASVDRSPAEYYLGETVTMSANKSYSSYILKIYRRIENTFSEELCWEGQITSPQFTMSFSELGHYYCVFYGNGSEESQVASWDVISPSGYCGDTAVWVIDSGYVLRITGAGIVDFTDSSSTSWRNHCMDYSPLITSVIIQDGISNIPDTAFIGCTNMTSIRIPDSVTSIGNYAFCSCNSLKNVSLPDNITSIGEYTFWCCSSLQSISIPDGVVSIGKEAFLQCTALSSVSLPNGLLTIGEYAFYGCSGLESVTLPSGLSSIGSYSFSDCIGLQSIIIPGSVTDINESAFEGCESLTTAVICNGVSTIGEYMFASCTSLESVTLPSSLITIDSFAFSGCSSLQTINIPSSVTGIGAGAFSYCTSLQTITVPQGVTEIERYTFDNCSNLTSISIPSSIMSIEEGGFEFCGALKDVYFNGSFDQFRQIAIDRYNSVFIKNARWHFSDGGTGGFCGDSLKWRLNAYGDLRIAGTGSMYSYSRNDLFSWFEIRNQIKTITVDDGASNVGDYAFYGSTNLSSVSLPDSISYIGKEAFYGCRALQSISVPGNVFSIGDGAFDGCSSMTSISLPDSLQSLGDYSLSQCANLSSIILPENLNSIGSYALGGCEKLTSLAIPESVTGIGEGAFAYCSSLSEITVEGENPYVVLDEYTLSVIDEYNRKTLIWCSNAINGEYVVPYDVSSIGDSAFAECEDLTSVTIGKRVWRIGEFAFSDCTGLTNVVFSDSVNSIQTIEFGAFWGCSGLTKMTIPNSVYYIGEDAFADCIKLESITLPYNLSEIGDYAFLYCDSLSDVYYRGSESQRAQITIGTDNECLLNAEWHYNVPIAEGVCGDSLTWKLDGSLTLTINGSGEMYDYYPDLAPWHDYSAGIESIAIGSNVESIGNGAFTAMVRLESVTVSPDNEYFSTLDGVLFNKDYSKIIRYPAKTGAYVIPDSVTNIGAFAFSESFYLSSITIPDSVTEIGMQAFINSASLTEFAIPEGITKLPSGMCSGCNGLQSISIPASVTRIESEAFRRCNCLADIYYGGTEEDRELISIEDLNDPLLNAEWHYTEPVAQGYAVTLTDYTKGLAAITGLTGGEDYAGEVAFTVSSDKACAVFFSTDGGTTCTRIAATPADDEAYGFTVDVESELTVYVAFIGDVNLDGKINTSDITQLKRYICGRRPLDDVQTVVANVNGDIKINTSDITQLKRFICGRRDFDW